MGRTRRPHNPLYVVELSGDSRRRGVQHGERLKAPIGRAVDFYRGFFSRYLGLDAAEVRRRAARFIGPTARCSPRLMSEYEGIAEGSGQALEDIFALSGRYEITYETVNLGECSNAYVGPRRSQDGHTLLGQNWDWRPEVLDFRAVLVAHCDDGPDHVVVTECGQPGKYGLNEHGLGVTATGLCCTGKTSVGDNLFVVVIREMLGQQDFDAACRVMRRHPPEATASFFLADDRGHAVNFEAAPAGLIERDLRPDEVTWHTNHCLLTDEPCTFTDSLVRGERWAELTEAPGPITWQTVGGWLADTRNGSNSICKTPEETLADTATWLQTMCSIVMDLDRRRLWVSDGLASEQPYREIEWQRPG
jgi:isopenicillin-N N-acyltransferase-like protein